MRDFGEAVEPLELVEGGAGASAQTVQVAGELARPEREVWCYHRQLIYCPIDNYASLFFMSKAAPTFPADYQRLRQRLTQIGWIALGSLVERRLPGQGGPRYQWSRRVGTKTVTVALSAEQFLWLKEAIANQRQVWDILLQMQQLTAQYMLENLPNPPRRKRFSKKRLGLN